MTTRILSAVCIVLAYFVTLNVNHAVVAYQDLSLNKFCAQSQLKTSFNQLMENRPQLYLMNGSDSAALIHQVWTDETLSDVAECTFTIESNIYTPDQQIGRGIYVSIRRLNFRQAHEECVDYVRFTFGGSKTQRICGDFDGDSKLGRMSHFNEDGGLIKVHIYVNKSQPLLNWNKRSLEIDLVFTAYEPCTDSARKRQLRCHPKEDHFCIDNHFREDGIINCPPPFCTDEPSKNCHPKIPVAPVFTNYRNPNGAAGLNAAALLIVLSGILQISMF